MDRLRLPCLPASGLVALLVALPGCGSGGEERLTQRDFAQRANATCRKAAKDLARLPKPESRKQFEQYVNRSGFVVQRLHDSLTALAPPERRAAVYDRFVKLVEGNIRAIHAVQRAVLEQRFARLAGIENSAVPVATRERSYTRQLGIPACTGVSAVDIPNPPAPPRESPVQAKPAPPAHLAGRAGRRDFVTGCALRASSAFCVCVFEQLTGKHGIDTEDEIRKLAEDTRPALSTGNPADIPAPLRKSVLACKDRIA